MGEFAHVVAGVGVPDACRIQSAVGTGDSGDLIISSAAAIVEHGSVETRIPVLVRLGLIIARLGVDDRLKVLLVAVARDGRLSVGHLVGIHELLRRAGAGSGATADNRKTTIFPDSRAHASEDCLLVLGPVIIRVVEEVGSVGIVAAAGCCPEAVVIGKNLGESVGGDVKSLVSGVAAITKERADNVGRGLASDGLGKSLGRWVR